MLSANEITDQVVVAAAAGSQRDVELVVEAMQPQARLMVAARLSPNPAQYPSIDDLTQQVVLAVTTGINRLEHRTVDGLKAWISGIVRNQVAQFIRRGGRDGAPGKVVRSLESTIEGLTQSAPMWQLLSGSEISPVSQVGRAERFARVMTELGRLKPNYREVITLAFCDQLPTRVIADRMKLSRNAVSMLLLRAIRTLQQQVLAASRIAGSDGQSA